MRIAVVASARHAIRRPFAGGLEAQTYRLATHLRRRGHDVRLFASADSDVELGVEPVLAPAHRVDWSEMARADPSMVPQRFLETHHAYLSLFARLRDEPVDVIHNHSLHYLPIAMAPSLPTPVLTTLHTPPTPWLESALAIAGDAPNVSCVSVSAANARSWRADVPILDVVPNGVPLEEWPFHATASSDRVAWAGRIVPEKGPHLAIDAARAAGRPIVLAGPVGDQAYHRDEVVPRLGVDAEYVGHLDGPDLALLLGGSAVLVATPCWEEPYGLVVAESLACGTPVAGFDRGATGEIVDDRTGRLVPAGDVDALARAIGAAARLDRADCRDRAETHCSIAAAVERYEALYEKVTS